MRRPARQQARPEQQGTGQTGKRRHGEKSLEYTEYRSNTAAGMAAATSPLVNTPSAAAAQATSIQRRWPEREEEGDGETVADVVVAG